ncbi:hypothetical protein IWZ00DRAFT_558256 [Phyllosticta capitalensis]
MMRVCALATLRKAGPNGRNLVFSDFELLFLPDSDHFSLPVDVAGAPRDIARRRRTVEAVIDSTFRPVPMSTLALFGISRRNDDNQSSDHFEPWSNNEQYLSDEPLDDDDDQETEADFTLDEDLDENEEDSSPSTPSVLRSFRYIDIGGEALQSLNSIFRHKSRQEFRAIMIECLSNCCDKAPEYYGKEPKAIVMGIHAYLAFLRRQDLVEDCVDSIIRAVPRSTQALLGTQWHAEQLKGLEGIHQSDGAGIYLDYVHTDGSLYPEHCAYAGSTNKFSRRLGQYEKSARTGVPAERGYHNQIPEFLGHKTLECSLCVCILTWSLHNNKPLARSLIAAGRKECDSHMLDRRLAKIKAEKEVEHCGDCNEQLSDADRRLAKGHNAAGRIICPSCADAKRLREGNCLPAGTRCFDNNEHILTDQERLYTNRVKEDGKVVGYRCKKCNTKSRHKKAEPKIEDGTTCLACNKRLNKSDRTHPRPAKDDAGKTIGYRCTPCAKDLNALPEGTTCALCPGQAALNKVARRRRCPLKDAQGNVIGHLCKKHEAKQKMLPEGTTCGKCGEALGESARKGRWRNPADKSTWLCYQCHMDKKGKKQKEQNEDDLFLLNSDHSLIGAYVLNYSKR